MIVGLVKTWDKNHRPKPEPPWRLLGLGLLFVNGMAAVFLPIGIFGSIVSAIALLILLFLPLFFAALKLTKIYGNAVFFALFLGFLSGPLSTLYLSHSFGYFLGLHYQNSTGPDALSEFPGVRIFRFSNARFLYKYQAKKTSIVAPKAPGAIQKPLYFHVVPWVSSAWKEGDPVQTWAACPNLADSLCDWDTQNTGVGESLSTSALFPYYMEAVEESGKIHHLRISPKPRILLPLSDPEAALVRTGLYGMSGLIMLNYLWVVGVIVWRRRNKESNP
ncbi:hypothetical protein LEP1GSC050_2213 [Leptospira broomii serovar Hurstbridge str. 5399]|uniref:Uncharacterized protein n=1 Tax=Leptospira broomii serovar Hurstbridge str. 5399 TaxID=1049789 RepID=T0F855_9LEPT|nr:hypothetical protein [Leptospira broomii]EQA44071.1 hypothetical protein LEP1GSC050_2213 [Leptospira broomii serovar Hurstbridge str. 5399]